MGCDQHPMLAEDSAAQDPRAAWWMLIEVDQGASSQSRLNRVGQPRGESMLGPAKHPTGHRERDVVAREDDEVAAQRDKKASEMPKLGLAIDSSHLRVTATTPRRNSLGSRGGAMRNMSDT